MIEEEREQLLVDICRLWPKKFDDSELEDFYQRLVPYRLRDIQAALDEYKSNNKFRPQISEILAKLKGKSVLKAERDLSHAQIIRQHWGLADSDMTDAETYLRFHAGILRRMKHSEAMVRRVRNVLPADLIECGIGKDIAVRFADAVVDPNLDRSGFNLLLADLSNCLAGVEPECPV